MRKPGLPVRSVVLKLHAGRLVVGWVTTSESRLSIVFVFFFWLEKLSGVADWGWSAAKILALHFSKSWIANVLLFPVYH